MSKLKVIVLAITFTILSVTGLKAQQAPIFTNYNNSYTYINPGFAGLSEGVNLLGLYRQQWAGGFTDDTGNSLAPQTLLVTGDMPIPALGGGISFSVLNDQLGYEKNTNVGLGYAYHFDLGGSTIGLGVSASLLNRAVNFGSLIPGQSGDPLLNQLGEESGMLFDLSAGLFFQIPESFYFGVSGINLLNTTDIDFISMQRPFVNDPSFLVDWQLEGNGESRCITCNNCYWKKTSTCHIKPCSLR